MEYETMLILVTFRILQKSIEDCLGRTFTFRIISCHSLSIINLFFIEKVKATDF